MCRGKTQVERNFIKHVFRLYQGVSQVTIKNKQPNIIYAIFFNLSSKPMYGWKKSPGKYDKYHSSLFKGKDILKIKSVTTLHLLETQKQNYFRNTKYW